MPVRSLRSSVLRWPDREAVDAAVRAWAAALAAREPGLVAVGYCGSYARGDHGVGSDVDLVVLVRDDAARRRPGGGWGVEGLPVPADVFTYTPAEWAALPERSPRWFRTLLGETVWVWGRPPLPPGPAPEERGPA